MSTCLERRSKRVIHKTRDHTTVRLPAQTAIIKNSRHELCKKKNKLKINKVQKEGSR